MGAPTAVTIRVLAATAIVAEALFLEQGVRIVEHVLDLVRSPRLADMICHPALFQAHDLTTKKCEPLYWPWFATAYCSLRGSFSKHANVANGTPRCSSISFLSLLGPGNTLPAIRKHAVGGRGTARAALDEANPEQA